MAITPVVALGASTATATIGAFDGLPEVIELGRLSQRNTIFAQSTAEGNVNGYVPIATIYDQNRVSVTADKISQYAKDATVDGEDRRFFEHGGIDVAAVVRASLGNLVASDVKSGASTISMQVVKNIHVQLALEQPTEEKRKAAYATATATSLDRKLKEMKLAIGLEKRYTKEEILTAYLNISFFGDNTYGIESAAQRYYSTSANDLTLAQAASLLAIVQYPNVRGLDKPENYPANQTRRDVILRSMYREGHITKAQLDEALKTPVDDTTLKLSPQPNGCSGANEYARWFCDYVARNVGNFEALGATPKERRANWKTGGYELYTTLDMDVQVNAQNQTWANVSNGETRFALGGSSVSVEVGTGRVLVMTENKVFNDTLAGAGPTAAAVNFNTSYDYGGSSGFQSGSTYKLFTLVTWLQAGHKLSETVNGAPRTENQAKFRDSCGRWGGPYPFKNDRPGGGPMTVLAATTASVNAAFISMALRLDLCAIRNNAAALGAERADGMPLETNPSSVLGTNQVTPISMVTAYAAIAAGGVSCKPIVLDRAVGPDGEELPGQPKDCHQAIAPEIAATVGYALSSVVRSGTGAASNPRDGVPLIGKTGTTDSANQTWIVTSTTRVATVVWVGNTVGTFSLRKYGWNGVSGAQLRHIIMRSTMAQINAKYGGGGFPPPLAKLK
jgi:membrane peptidoglycan carboxypeptidase